MKTLTALKAKAEQARGSHAYRAEGASIRFTEDHVAFMKTSGLTRTALAEKIGSSPAYITKILRGITMGQNHNGTENLWKLILVK